MKISLLPKKDQHLLVDKKVLQKLIEEAELKKEDKVIEIGAGTGNITRELIRDAGEVLAFELDKRFKEYLAKIKAENLKIIYGSALDYDWNGYDKIVANIPYSISEPVINKAIKSKIKALVIFVGENFSRLLLSDSKIGIISKLFFDIKIIMSVKKESFFPMPDTGSSLVKLVWKQKTDKVEEILKKILARKGKTKNAMLYAFVELGKTKKQAKEIIKNINLHKNILEKPVKKLTGKFLILLKEKLKLLQGPVV